MNRKHVIVVGGGIAGLVAAKVLHELFEHVTLVEMDEEYLEAEARKGAPQAFHPHNLLKRGKDIVCEKFEGLEAELDRRGSPPAEFPLDIRRLGAFGDWEPRYPSGMKIRLLSRPFLENILVERVQKLPNLKFMLGARVCGLAVESGKVIGVRLKEKSAAAESVLSADLVIDASGRKGHLRTWLLDAGLEAPEESKWKAGEWYVTRHYKLREEARDWKVIYVPKALPIRVRERGAFIGEVDNGRHIVSLVGSPPHSPPRTEKDFLDFAKQVDGDAIFPALEGGTPLGKFEYFSNFDNICLRVDLAKTWPKGLVAIGDALARFNPVYGQGMSCAIMGADALGEKIKSEVARAERGEPEVPWEKDFQHELIALLETPWAFSTMESLEHAPIGDAPSPELFARLRRWVFTKLTNVIYISIFYDKTMHLRFVTSQHLLKSVKVLYQPNTLARAFWYYFLAKVFRLKPVHLSEVKPRSETENYEQNKMAAGGRR